MHAEGSRLEGIWGLPVLGNETGTEYVALLVL